MGSHTVNDNLSVFRSDAWVQAWIDTWGNHSNIRLIDLGGRKRPLEYVYTGRTQLKKIIPVSYLALAGVASPAISSPRSEYNHTAELISLYGGTKEFAFSLAGLAWQQCKLPDLVSGSANALALQEVCFKMGAYYHIEKKEPSYSVASQSLEPYLNALGASTRLAYFNRRERLLKHGTIEFQNFSPAQAPAFFLLLNKFHSLRWGQACYSAETQKFMSNFMERFVSAGGDVIMQALLVSGEIVSVILDLIWQGRRYNLQSGYYENKFPKIALGALHLGYAIEAAIGRQQIYDFMAGTGKQRDYKVNIATHQFPIESVSILRGHAKYARKLYNIVKKKID